MKGNSDVMPSPSPGWRADVRRVTFSQPCDSGSAVSMAASRPISSRTSTWRKATSQQAVVQVKPKITFTPRGSRFYTTVSAADHSWAGHFVYLQRLSRFGQWVTTLKLKLGPKSARLFRIPRRHGVTVYRVAMTVNQAGAGYLDSHSGTQKIRRR